MPRSIEEILEQADDLAARFENHDPNPHDVTDAAPLRALREAFRDRAAAEKRVADLVAAARTVGHSWAAIGATVGTSGEAARQRYSRHLRRALSTVPGSVPLWYHWRREMADIGRSRRTRL